MPTLYAVTLTFTTDVLGTVPLNKQVYTDFIASKEGAPYGAVEEVDTIAMEDKGKTGFHRLPDGTPALYNYTIKGYLKDACGMLWRVEDSHSKKIKAYKRVIDGLIFVEPRLIPIVMAGEMGELQRPLRAETAQGPRVALAFSETVPAGSSIAFDLVVLDDKSVPEEWLHELWSYAKWRGIGQWRNAGHGCATYTMTRK